MFGYVDAYHACPLSLSQINLLGNHVGHVTALPKGGMAFYTE